MLHNLISSTGTWSRFEARVNVRTQVSGSFSASSGFKGTLVTFLFGAFSTMSNMIGSLVFPKIESTLTLTSPLSVLPRKPEPYGTANRPYLFVRQTKLRVVVETGRSLANVAYVRIKFKKPSGAFGYWDASIKDATKGTVFYDVVPPIMAEPDKFDLDEAGTWTFWAWAKCKDNREIPGDPVAVVVYTEGSKEIRK